LIKNSINRRNFLSLMGIGAASLGLPSFLSAFARINGQSKQPNVILILTDDQGYGDVGYTGNTKIDTPNIDKFARENVELSQFYVSPCCTPTRASLLTGRYSFRLPVVWVGQPLHPEEITLADYFQSAGYKTACFGKWGNLGTNYPLRAIDRGFDEAVVHRKGQFSQPHNKTGYFDPILEHNGIENQYDGYCNDIWFDEAEKFIEKNQQNPFFVYLPTNLPHSPAQVPDAFLKPYKVRGFDDALSRIYGMITHIDNRFGRLIDQLKKLQLYENTIIVFLSDNGPDFLSEYRYNAGLRGRKSYVYEGGIRVPCIFSWPGRVKGGEKIDKIAAHIDIMPTLLDAAGIKPHENIKFDGTSLLSLLENKSTNWSDRLLFCQGYGTADPQIRRCFMVRTQRYKLVQQTGLEERGFRIPEDNFRYELFDMINDPQEKNDIAEEHPMLVKKLIKEYENWFADVSSDRPFKDRLEKDYRARVHVGSPRQNPVRIEYYGKLHGRVFVERAGDYDITLEPFGIVRWKYWQLQKGDTSDYKHAAMRSYQHKYLGDTFVAKAPGFACFKIGETNVSKVVDKGVSSCIFENVHLPAGRQDFEVCFEIAGKKTFSGKTEDGLQVGPVYVTMKHMN